MIRTPICDLLDIEHPIALGGMGSATSPELVAAVSRAGGLGALGCHYQTPEQIRERTAAIRQGTNQPFGLNFLLFDTREDSFEMALGLKPNVMQFAWARPEQNLKDYFERAQDAGCKVTHMAGTVDEAERAAEAGADIIIAQGTEGGGHVGWMASMPLIPMVVDAVSPIPVSGGGRLCRWTRSCRGARARRAGHSARNTVPRHHGIAAASELQASHRRQRRTRHPAERNSGHRVRAGLAWRHDALTPQSLHRTLGGTGMGASPIPRRGLRQIARCA